VVQRAEGPFGQLKHGLMVTNMKIESLGENVQRLVAEARLIK